MKLTAKKIIYTWVMSAFAAFLAIVGAISLNPVWFVLAAVGTLSMVCLWLPEKSPK